MTKNKENAKYRVEWNTGDYNWDNYPDVWYYESLEDAIEDLDLTAEQIVELNEWGSIYDETETEWRLVEL